MKNLPKTLLAVALLGFAFAAHAQTPVSTTPTTPSTAGDSAYGLLGEHYTGLRFAYTDIDEGPFTVGHTYGLVANRPTAPNLDAMFKYDYSRISGPVMKNRQHTVAAGATAYLSYVGFKPFVEGNLGWVFQKASAGRQDSFMFFVAAGAEIQLAPQLVLTPYVSYQETPHFDAQVWNYGAKATFRLAREWSVTAGVQIDEHSSVEYRFGVNRHF